MAVSDSEILGDVQFAVMEPYNNGQTITSELWTITEVIGYLNDRVSRFVAETKIALVRATHVTTPGVSRYDLSVVSTGIVDLARVAWLTNASYSYELERAEMLRYDLLDNSWPVNPAIPLGYSITLQPNLSIDLMPPPDAQGFLDLLYTGLGTALSNTGVTLPLPDDFAPIIKWGVVADMLKKDGLAHDAERAAYAEQRFSEGVELAKILVGLF